MEVATLTAVLEARIAAFQANMLTADALLKATQDLMRQNQRTAAELSATMEKIRLDERNVSQTVTGAEQMGKSIAGVRDKAVEAKGAMDLRLGGTAQVVADAAVQERALNKVRDAAVEARIAESLVGKQGTGVLRPFVAEGGFGQFTPGAAQAEPYLPPKRGFYQPPPRGFIGEAPASIIGPSATTQYEKPIGPVIAADSQMMKEVAADREALRKYQEIRKMIVDSERVRSVGPLPDYVRLYRGESATPVTNVPDWMSSGQGRWFTDSLAESERYAKTRGGEVQTVDVPRTVAQSSQTTRPAGGAGGQEFLLPAEIAAQKRPLREVREQEARGAIPMPAAPSVVGGEDAYRKYRENLLNSQRSGTGALVMGPADVQRTWGQLFEEKVRGVQKETAATRRARTYLESKGVSDVGRGFEDVGGGLFGRPDQAGGGDGGGDGRRRDGFLGFGDGRPGGLARAVFSSLPGGRRPSTLALTTLAGLGVAALPAAGPAVVGGTFGAATMGLGALAGSIGTLKLAFSDLSAQAFTNRQEFDKLTPVQQQFVQTLRSLDAGLGKSLEQIAQQQLLPRINTALRSTFTPNMTQTLAQGVNAFAGGIGGGLQQVGKTFGSKEFTSALGPVLQADARYVQSFIVELGKFADAWIHVSQAAIPFTDWLDRLTMRLATWTDNSLKAAQASGKLGEFFDRAREGLQAFGHLASSMLGLLNSIIQLVGFQNALSTLNMLSGLLNGIGATLNANRELFRTAFAGLLQGVQDVIAALGALMQGIQPLFDQLRALSDQFRNLTQSLGLGRNGLNLFRVAVDALVATIGVRLLLGMINAQRAIATTGTVAATTATSVNTLGVAAATGAASAGRLTGALLALKNIGLIAITLDILTNFLPQGNIPNPLKNYPIAGSVFGFGQLIGGGRGEDLSKVPLETDAFKFWSNKGTKISSSNPLFWTDIQAGRINAQQVQALRSHFVSKDQYTAALTFATQTAQAAAAGGTGATPYAVAGAASVGATGIPTPEAFAPPAPFAGTKGNILPQKFLTAIAAADYSQKVPNEVATRKAAIAWIEAHRGQYTKPAQQQDLQNLLAEGAALKQQITSLTGENATASRTGTGFLSVEKQNALATAQQAVAGSGIQGTSLTALSAAGPQVIQGQIASVKELVRIESESLNTLKHTTVTQKEHKALLAEQTSLAKDLASNLSLLSKLTVGEKLAEQATKLQEAANSYQQASGMGATLPEQLKAANTYLAALQEEKKTLQTIGKEEMGRLAVAKELHGVQADINKVQKDQHSTQVAIKQERILGILKADTPPGVQSLRTRERSILEGEAKREHLVVPGGLSLPDLIKNLQHQGMEIPKASLASLRKINEVMEMAKRSNEKLLPEVSQNITARLTQINNTLKQNRHPSNFRIPNENKLLEMAGLGHLKGEAKREAGAGLVAVAELFGKLPVGGAALGVPLTAGNLPLLSGAKQRGIQLPHHVSGHAMVGGAAQRGVQIPHHVSGAHSTTTVVQHVTINIKATNPAETARAVREELLKGARRNPTQTRGPNAGRNRGLN